MSKIINKNKFFCQNIQSEHFFLNNNDKIICICFYPRCLFLCNHPQLFFTGQLGGSVSYPKTLTYGGGVGPQNANPIDPRSDQLAQCCPSQIVIIRLKLLNL